MRDECRDPPGIIAVRERWLPRHNIAARRRRQSFYIAFAITAAALASWEAWLSENGIAVEEKRTWDLGGQSLYFRDPDRHLIEVATPGVWSNY